MKQRFFISNAIGEEKLPFISVEKMKFGRAHYSWKIVADLYDKGLSAANIEVLRVIRPEIYQSKISQNTFNLRHDDVHLAVKPIEHLRTFNGIKNIFISGWEFSEFSTTPYENNPLYNQIEILRHADQVWCWSEFTTRNLQSYGIKTAITMPPPVVIHKIADEKSISNLNTLSLNTYKRPEIADVRQLSEVLQEYKDSTIFFSIFNPHDHRKQSPLMMEAFIKALDKNPNILLIVKLVIDNVDTTLGTMQTIFRDIFKYNGKSDKIIFIGETLSDYQIVSLMKLSKYYLCTSSTEGLNLPLIEAMSNGLVPVSSNATAMADYVNSDNAILIDTTQVETNGTYHFLHKHLVTTHFVPKIPSIVDAIIKASRMSLSEYKRLSDNAKQEVNRKYSLSSFVKNLTLLRA